jgi:DNA polymerase-3 subunit alpha
MIDFNLFIQSTYSLNGSIIDIETLVDKAQELGYKTLGLVDHNHMYGAIKFYKKCLSKGIKPIIGLEIEIESNFFGSLPIVLLSVNNNGYKNLIQISSLISSTEKTFIEDIQKYLKDIVIVLKTDEGVFSKSIFENDLEKTKNIFNELKGYMDNIYLGLDVNDYSIELKVAPVLDNIGQTIIMNKVKYLNKEDVKTSNILAKILREQDDSIGLFKGEDISYDLKSLKELNKMYSAYPRAVKNSIDFIEKCDLKIDLKSRHLPKYPLEGITAYDKLSELSNKGLVRRLMQADIYSKFDIYKNRLDFELEIIKKMGYEDYFLIVWDFVLYAKKNRILVGPGRGSAAGSLVAYALGIVDVDPIKHDLYFERFLNPERITMPDIDMDFPDDKREDVIQYVISKYGKGKVVSIITFGTFQGKSAIRDVGRILEIDNVVLDELSKNLSKSNNSLEEFRKQYPREYSYYMNIDYIRELIEVATKLNGLVKHTSTHAAGIIISGEDIREYSPIQPGLMGAYQTQYEASDLEDIGLLKFDFLGLRNLSIISTTIDLIKADTDEDINIYKIPLDDSKTYQLLKDVNTLGVFQLESRGMMDLVRKMQIEEFEEIATCISLFRPGPMENIPAYLRIRNNEERVTYPDLDLLPILKKTNGIIVYQEQIMEIANKFAGYSLGQADVLRRAVSKKKRDVLESERVRFVNGAKNQGYPEKTAELIYDYIVKFANYGFNKSHAVAYALVAYWMAYLKANYGKYFMSVLLDSQIGSVSGTKRYIMECQKMKINILPPRINKSNIDYVPEDNDLRYPIKGIKGVGPIAAKSIVSIQEESPVHDLLDFVSRRRDVHINVIEALIYAGAFDDFKYNKKTMIENLPKIMNFVDFNYKKEDFSYIEYEEYDFDTLHEKEKELLGVNFKYHTIYRYNETIKKEAFSLVSDIIDNGQERVTFVGSISRIKTIKTKRQEEMAFIEIEDLFNSIEGIVFPNIYSYNKNKMLIGSVFVFRGKIENRNNKDQVIIDSIKDLKEF